MGAIDSDGKTQANFLANPIKTNEGLTKLWADPRGAGQCFPCELGGVCPCLPAPRTAAGQQLSQPPASQVLSMKKELNPVELDFLLRFPFKAGVVSPVDFLQHQGWGGIKVGLRP